MSKDWGLERSFGARAKVHDYCEIDLGTWRRGQFSESFA